MHLIQKNVNDYRTQITSNFNHPSIIKLINFKVNVLIYFKHLN